MVFYSLKILILGCLHASQFLSLQLGRFPVRINTEAMTFHWEFTLGSDRIHEIIDTLPFPALGQNIFDAEWVAIFTRQNLERLQAA